MQAALPAINDGRRVARSTLTDFDNLLPGGLKVRNLLMTLGRAVPPSSRRIGLSGSEGQTPVGFTQVKASDR
jgi:hypothetical protein